MRNIISTDKAPAAIGPYSQANVISGDTLSAGLIFTSGQIPLDPATGEIVGTTIEEQTRQVFTNIKALLEASGSSLDHVLKTTVFLKDMEDFTKMNTVYAEFFTEGAYPSRSAVEVARLPKDVLVEVETIAYI